MGCWHRAELEGVLIMWMSNFDYQKYLASREWALLKEAVKDRDGNVCERCRKNPHYSVHHLTYEHVGHESLEELLGVCNDCHKFLSAKSNYDPTQDNSLSARYPYECSPEQVEINFDIVILTLYIEGCGYLGYKLDITQLDKPPKFFLKDRNPIDTDRIRIDTDKAKNAIKELETFTNQSKNWYPEKYSAVEQLYLRLHWLYYQVTSERI
jgi:hypothetical protein